MEGVVGGERKSCEAERRKDVIILSGATDEDSVKLRNRSSASPSTCAILFVRGVVFMGKRTSGRVAMKRSD